MAAPPFRESLSIQLRMPEPPELALERRERRITDRLQILQKNAEPLPILLKDQLVHSSLKYYKLFWRAADPLNVIGFKKLPLLDHHFILVRCS